MENVLNLIINGWPSIPKGIFEERGYYALRFKPYYKWMTFNTELSESLSLLAFMF